MLSSKANDMIAGLHHIGIAVTDLDAAVKLWIQLTGGKLVHRELLGEQLLETATLKIGELHIELLRPISNESPIAKFIERRGPGIHHIALQADSTQHELDRLKAGGIKLIDQTARLGSEGTQIGFIHPRAIEGVLLEIVETAEKKS